MLYFFYVYHNHPSLFGSQPPPSLLHSPLISTLNIIPVGQQKCSFNIVLQYTQEQPTILWCKIVPIHTELNFSHGDFSFSLSLFSPLFLRYFMCHKENFSTWNILSLFNRDSFKFPPSYVSLLCVFHLAQLCRRERKRAFLPWLCAQHSSLPPFNTS